MSLSSLIVQREIATIRQVEEALARQVLYGGDLVTNLLEVAKLDEATLTVLLAESFGLPAATLGPLPMPSERARSLVPSEMASSRAMVPLTMTQGAIVVAVAEPLPKEAEEELTFALGLRVEQRIAPMVRVREGLARAYGAPLERRLQRLLARLGSAPVEYPAAPPDASSTRPSYRPSSATPTSATLPQASVRPPPAAPTGFAAPSAAPEPTETSESPRATLLQRDSAAPRAPRRRRGPITPDVARKELDEAETRDAILDLFFDYARQYFDYSALFVVHGDIAEGREAYGDGASRERVQAIGVPLDLPSILATARDARSSVRVLPSDDGLDPVLLGDLERTTRGEVLLAPLVVRTRAVAILYGDSGDDGVDGEAVKEVVAFAQLVGPAFEKLIVRKKLGGYIAQAVPVAARVESERVPSKREPPTVAPIGSVPAAAFAASERPPIRDSASSPDSPPDSASAPLHFTGPLHLTKPLFPAVATPESMPAIRSALAPESLPPPIHLPTPDSLPPPRSAPPPDSFPPPRSAPLPDSLPPPRSAPLPDSLPPPLSVPVPLSAPMAPASRQISPAAASVDVISVRPALSGFDAELLDIQASDLPPPSTAAAVNRPSGPPIPREEPPSDSDKPPRTPRAPESSAPISSHSSAPPSESSFAVAPHRPPSSRAADSPSLPSVIVDVDEAFGALVDRVVAMGNDEAAEAELIRQGPKAMPAIMSRFPGPTVVDRARVEDGSLRVAECGPVLRLIAAQRRTALPFVLPLLGDGDPVRRYWATFLITELAYAEAVDPVVPRLFDPDPSVRRVARFAARAVADVAPEALMERLVRYYRDPSLSNERRIEMIETLGELRERLAVPLLIEALNDAEDLVAAAARRALMTITRQDMGRDAKRWQTWWAQNAGRHRIEWLIEALMHDVPAIRRAAGDELKALTKEYFGYYDDLPRKDREKSQHRYREWWNTEGRLRFQRR